MKLENTYKRENLIIDDEPCEELCDLCPAWDGGNGCAEGYKSVFKCPHTDSMGMYESSDDDSFEE